jgi:hypothetical protein
VTTGLAAQTDEAVAEYAAGEEVFELALQEAGRLRSTARVCSRKVQLLAHDEVEQGLLWIAVRRNAGCARVCIEHERRCVGK